KKLSRLNDVMHPAIIREIKKEYESVVDGIVVIDAPLLFETGLADTVDLVVVVAADPETVIKRASSRGFKEEETRGIIDAQMPIEEKKKLADFVIDNNGNRDNTKQGVEKLWKKIQDL
ncbi:MAG TPA: dephospho-CoA kinase, partial [Candidatus Omnitrophota bacterium]|nr:dephospho-CoA kinase [Candidatus Omnitrophota bacterium]